MAHNLFGTRFIAARTPAWHKIGRVLSDEESAEMTFAKALDVAQIDYTYEKVPVFWDAPDGTRVTSPDRFVVLRSPTADDPQWRDVGLVSRDYQVFSNAHLARGMDIIRKQTGWQFETLGALEGGAATFMVIKTGGRTVFGDQWKSYLLLNDDKGGGGALTFKTVEERVVCRNTLNFALGERGLTINIAHDHAAMEKFDFWANILGKIQESEDLTFAQLEALGSVKIGLPEVKRIVDAALPIPGPTNDMQALSTLLASGNLSKVERIDVEGRLEAASVRNLSARGEVAQRRLATLELYERFNIGKEQGAISSGSGMSPEALRHLRETPYAAVQAVVELVDHAGIANAQVAARSALFGEGAKVKSRAWKEALALATV